MDLTADRIPTVPTPASHRMRCGSETRRRQLQVGVRLTVEEKSKVEILAAEAGLTVPDYLRRAALGGRVRLRAAPDTGSRAVADALRAIAGQAGAIGNNLNQIARGVNVAILEGLPPSPDVAALLSASAALDRLRDDVRRALDVQPVMPP